MPDSTVSSSYFTPSWTKPIPPRRSKPYPYGCRPSTAHRSIRPAPPCLPFTKIGTGRPTVDSLRARGRAEGSSQARPAGRERRSMWPVISESLEGRFHPAIMEGSFVRPATSRICPGSRTSAPQGLSSIDDYRNQSRLAVIRWDDLSTDVSRLSI